LNLDDFIQKVNSDLVGKVVNIASRCAKFIGDQPLADHIADADLWHKATAAGETIAEAYEKREFGRAIREIMAIADAANEYMAAREPWKLAKEPGREGDVNAICSLGVNLFRALMIYLKPVLPAMAAEAEAFLNDELRWQDPISPLRKHRINSFKPLMQRVDKDRVDAMIEAGKEALAALDGQTAAPPESPVASPKESPLTDEPLAAEISFEDFIKVDLRVARI